VRPLRDGCGQDEAAVVIRVLADQVNAAWSLSAYNWRASEEGLKAAHEGKVHTKASAVDLD
jgi:hypothetical protein